MKKDEIVTIWPHFDNLLKLSLFRVISANLLLTELWSLVNTKFWPDNQPQSAFIYTFWFVQLD